MPALDRARRKALDVSCTANARQTALATGLYQNDWPDGVQNYAPDCPYWGRGWVGETAGPHAQLGPSEKHFMEEGRSLRCYWRGYLLAGNYADSHVLGCAAGNYVGKDFISSYNNLPSNHVETNFAQDSFRAAPAFLWYGPGIYSVGTVSEYAGGNLVCPWWDDWGTWHEISYYHRRFALFTCPRVWVRDWANKVFEIPHRPHWPAIIPSWLHTRAGCGNLAYSDGSVEFYEMEDGGNFCP